MIRPLLVSLLPLAAALFTNPNPTLFGSLSLLTVAWILSNLYGGFRTITNVQDALAQRKAALSDPVDPLAVQLARIDLIVQRVLVVFQATGVIAGVMAVFLPLPTCTNNGTLDTMLIVLLIIGRSVLMSGLSDFVARSRKHIITMLEAEHAARMRPGGAL